MLLFIGIGIIASTNLMTNLAIGQSNLSKETMENAPKGMKNMSMSLNEIRNRLVEYRKLLCTEKKIAC